MSESVGNLFISLGLDASQLESGFVEAEKSITENLARLSNEKTLVQIRGQIELDGLDEAASNSEKLRIQEEALAAQMDIQRDKIRIVAAAYEELARTQGIDAQSTQAAALQLEQERLALSNLEKQTRDLSKQQEIALGVNFEMLSLIESAFKGIDALVAAGRAIPIPHAKAAAAAAIGLSAIIVGSSEATKELRENNPARVLDEEFSQASENIDNSWTQIVDETRSATDEICDSITEIGESAEDITDDVSNVVDLLQTEDVNAAIRRTNALLDETDSILGKIVAAAIGASAMIMAIEASLVEMATPAIEGFRDLENTAHELSLSLEKTNDLLSQMKIAGVDLRDARDYVRGVQDAVIKGDSSDPELITMEKYSVIIQDANGKLLAFDETLDRLYEGYLKARAAGEAEAYAMMTNGQAIKDILPYFERRAQAEEDMAKIKWSTLDAATLKEASRDMRLVETQIDEFKNALSSLAVPAADIALKETFETFKAGTKFIEENRETVIYWGFVLMEAIKSVKAVGVEAADWALEKLTALKDKLAEFDSSFNISEKIASIVAKFQSDSNAPTDNIFTRAAADTEEFIEANEKARAAVDETQKSFDAGLSYSSKRIDKFRAELASIELELDFGVSEYDKDIAQLDLWWETALRDARQYSEEQAVIQELAAAKMAKIEQDKEMRVQEIRDSVNAQFQSDLQNRIDSIEKERAAWIGAGMEEAEATTLAQKLITKAYEDRAAKLEEIRESVRKLDRTDLANSFLDIQKNQGDWLAAGMDESEAVILADRLKLEEIDKLETAFAEKRAELWQSDLEKQLARIEKEKQAWIDKGIAESAATEWAEQAKAKTIAEFAQDESEQVASAINQFNAEVARSIDSIWKTSLENRLDEIEREKQAWIDKGLAEVKATEWAEQAKADARRNAAMSVLKSELDEYRAFQKGGYNALREYQLKQLYKSGIRPEDLQMTPEQLQQFQRAQMISQHSLLPNMMSQSDKSLAHDASNFGQLGKAFGLGLSNIGNLDTILGDLGKKAGNVSLQFDNLSGSLNDFAGAISNQIQSTVGELEKLGAPPMETVDISTANLDIGDHEAVEKFAALTAQVDDVTAKFVDLGAVLGDERNFAPVDLDFPEMTIPPIDTAAIDSAFENLVAPMNEVNARFAEMSNQLASITNGLADFSQSLNQFSEIRSQNNSSKPEAAVPPNITVTVQISEAHAWDSQHIQQLADKVADAIEPELVRAIGGDSNRY